MSSRHYCPHGDDPNLCPPCQGPASLERTDVGPVFVARRVSDCPSCATEIVPGDEARMVDGVTQCRSCADLEERGIL